ncbi:putative ribosomal large subunit pseudouridine synthase SVR1, chloroplastic isoform X2 [Solanum verrucosum]|uniref:putative ribosomal large subunit pseudouridine synthase SVR1, chloroplastic isoform X2 n=1 Tax=Solanum verrucosum TaxID=315347 RepID=UPI0020D0B3D2|nr:putative ribosomal large subunit pseudouridine synthase SVR1, chloroplastic isoform X2 [Solanum verrucosum]XP_049379883.1 putative ribosomal large subunit pseudouridine synthase SVR1, chloroplastic isoform X2 [Solanum stenotomum]
MAAIAAAVAAATSAFTSFHLTRATPYTRLHIRTFITSSLSSSSTKFNITFAPPKPKPKPKPEPAIPINSDSDSNSVPNLEAEIGDQLYIPWIVRDEKGNLTLQSTPPARLLHEMANASTSKKKKKGKEVASKAATVVPTPEPKHSKAARRFYNENFRDPPQRLSKVLAAAGVASRRSSEELIFQGRVTVNGSVCKTPQTKVDPARDVIYVNGNRLPKKLPTKVYLALNKPKGYICSSGEKETKSVMSLFDDFIKSWDKRHPGQPKPRLFTVGRLDVATTGLIIVTNDGEFTHQISHPSSNLSKEYIATIDGEVHKRHLIAISEGTVIDGVHCTPDNVELLPGQPDLSRPRLRIVLRALKRIRIGGFRLPADLALGKHVELNQANLKALGWKS